MPSVTRTALAPTVRTLQALDATHAITTFVDDAHGRRLSVRDPDTVGQHCTYDALSRDLHWTDTARAVMSSTYDLAGNGTPQTDANGQLTAMVYDLRGRRTTLTDRNSAVTAWDYDVAGHEFSMTDAQTKVYTHDNSGPKITTQWPDHAADNATFWTSRPAPSKPKTTQRRAHRYSIPSDGPR